MCIVAIVTLTGCNSVEESEKAIEMYGYEPVEENIVLENEFLKFAFNPNTTQFQVEVKETGEIWYSNPVGASEDTFADATSLKALQSTLTIKYSNIAGVATTLNNYDSSIENGLYNYEVSDNKIRVNYTIGDVERVYIFPQAVPESRLNEFKELMEKSDQSKIEQYYKRYDINRLAATDDKDALMKQYPDLANERVFVLRDTVQPYLKIQLENMFAAVGYTLEDYEIDSVRYETGKKSENPTFNASVIYELDGKDLLVSVPLDSINYKEEYPVTEIRILGYLGAGSTEDNGFLLVPDGSGGLINFNNGKTTQSAYNNTVYGWDYAIKRTALIDENRAVFPVFGISRNDSSLLCILEEGSAFASVEADVAGRLHSYNYAAAKYILLHNEDMDISSKSDSTIKMYEESLPEGQITQRYIFVEDNEYVSMATRYREYLLSRYETLSKSTETEVPITVELIGAIDRRKLILGVPAAVPKPLTTYDEVMEVVDDLTANNVTNLNIKYNGWFNDSINHKTPMDVELISELGDKKTFEEMITTLKEKNVDLYLESNFQFMYRNGLFDGYSVNRDSAKLVNREVVELLPFSISWFAEKDWEDYYYLAKPSYMIESIQEYEKQIKELGANNIAFRTIGKQLSADYNPKDKVSREEALNLQVEQMAKLYNNNTGMIVSAGNAYVLPYVDFIVDMKLDSKGFNIIDEEIPFYPIALHGLVPYAGGPMNMAEDATKNLLKSVEAGAGLYYVLMTEPSSSLQRTKYTVYYGADYDLWSDSVKETYNRFQAELGHIYNQYIIGHEKLASGVYKTTYEDGTKVYVNYNDSAYNENGIQVEANNFTVEGGTK